ncbi:MAG: hypothetical protein TEF_16935 [Rhizobiales bacterium NRL2]|jgi:thiol-disulfide isomerase/thioredoxin|nr:MAG: hypothetical protein TEF_16935 [Rhizobiales bacterium NRL2]
MKLRLLPALVAVTFLNLTAAAAEPPLAKFAAGEVANFTAHAEPRPLDAIAFQDADGAERSLADFEGQVVLVNLWATWCAPCRHEMPSLDRLAEAIDDPEFSLVAISLDRAGADKAKAFLDEIGVENLDFYIDPSARTGMRLQAFGLPVTILIGRDGRELGRLVGPAEWDSEEAQALIRAALAGGS